MSDIFVTGTKYKALLDHKNLLAEELSKIVKACEKEAAEAGVDETPWLDSARAALKVKS